MIKQSYYINWNVIDTENYSKISEQLPEQVIGDSFLDAMETAIDIRDSVSGCEFIGISKGSKIFIKD